MAIDLTDLGSFASLYEVSVGFIAVSGAIQEISKRRVASLNEMLDEIYQLKEAVRLSESKLDEVDEKLGEIEPLITRFSVDSKIKAKAISLATWMGLSIPIIILYNIGLGKTEVGIFFVNITLLICFLWGPFILLIHRVLIHRDNVAIAGRLRDLRVFILR